MRVFYRAKYETKQKVRLPLSAYLSYLLVATLLLTGISFSKFASTGSTDDGARVAVVVVDGGSSDATDLALGDGVESAGYSFYITNDNANGLVSEVALSYTISVTVPDGNLPDGVAVTLTYDGGEPYKSEDPVDGVYTFAGGADFAAGASEQHNYTLTFTVTDESLLTEDSSFEGIEISVKAEQIG